MFANWQILSVDSHWKLNLPWPLVVFVLSFIRQDFHLRYLRMTMMSSSLRLKTTWNTIETSLWTLQISVILKWKCFVFIFFIRNCWHILNWCVKFYKFWRFVVKSEELRKLFPRKVWMVIKLISIHNSGSAKHQMKSLVTILVFCKDYFIKFLGFEETPF